MEWAVSAKEMKSCDSNTSSYYGIPSLVLMERAALRVVEAIGQEPSRFRMHSGWVRKFIIF